MSTSGLTDKEGQRTDGAKKSSETSRIFPPRATDDTSVVVDPRTASNDAMGRISKGTVVLLVRGIVGGEGRW